MEQTVFLFLCGIGLAVSAGWVGKTLYEITSYIIKRLRNVESN